MRDRVPSSRRGGGPVPPWTVWQTARHGDQHYQESVQECADSIRNALAAEGIDPATQDRVLGRLGVDFGPPPARARMTGEQQEAQRRFEEQYYGPVKPPPPPPGTYRPPMPPESELPDGIDGPLGPPGPFLGCPRCAADAHRCPGCGEPVNHNQVTCETNCTDAQTIARRIMNTRAHGND